jgi:hypothetical protein
METTHKNPKLKKIVAKIVLGVVLLSEALAIILLAEGVNAKLIPTLVEKPSVVSGISPTPTRILSTTNPAWTPTPIPTAFNWRG